MCRMGRHLEFFKAWRWVTGQTEYPVNHRRRILQKSMLGLGIEPVGKEFTYDILAKLPPH